MSLKLGIFGPQGSGKSYFAMVLARLLASMDSNVMIYTNMNVEGHNIVVIDDLGMVPLDDHINKILIVDEAYYSLDSRNSNSKQNSIWTKCFALFRKGDVVLSIFITHRPRMLDVNIREQLDMILMCRKNKVHFDYLLMDMITEQLKSIHLPKTKQMFDYADFDTKDMPFPITVDSLVDSPLFKITTAKDIKEKQKLRG
jgi:ABC-type bacteriocin/lantibiotic exporter with double-glycine peptidase domain